VLAQLAREMERRNIRLVVLDSAAALPRLEYDSSQITERQQHIAGQVRHCDVCVRARASLCSSDADSQRRRRS